METLSFKIGLSGTFFNNVPAYSILVNRVKQASGKVSEKTEVIEFSVALEEDQEHLLEIRLENKVNADTIIENGVIVKDTLLNIDSIVINDIEIGNSKWSLSEFVADDIKRPTLTNCVNLGWNGSYRIRFSSPFYLWLLENM